MKRAVIRLSILATFAFSSFLFAETDEKQKAPASAPTEHYEIVVTATRLETPARDIASSVAVISSDEIERSRMTFALEAISGSGAVSVVQSGGPGAAASIFVRGANSEHTLVLVDGVEINDPVNPSRSADLSHFDLLNIERIEIFRGPLSPLYGSDALGGLINLITERGARKPRWKLSASGGSFKTLLGQAGVSGSAGPLDYSFGLSRYQTDGISAAAAAYAGNSEPDGYDSLNLSARLGIKFRENIEASVSARSIRASTEIDNFGGPSGDDPNNVQDYGSLFLRGEVRGLFLANRWEQKLVLAAVDSHRDHRNPPDPLHPLDSEEGFFKSRLLKLDWQNNIFLHPSNTLTFGVELENERAESEYRSDGAWGPYESLFPARTAATSGFYLQEIVRSGNRFFAAAGVRFDRHSRAGDSFTFRLSPAYVIPATGTKIRASLGTGFKSPSLYQLYAPPTAYGPIGNETLKPERLFGREAGVEQSLFSEKVRVGAAYFVNTFRELIDFDFSRGYVNIGRAASNGIELDLECRPDTTLFFKASLTRLRARNEISQDRLLRRPENMLSARLDYSFSSSWSVSLLLSAVGEREDVDYSSGTSRRVTLDPYVLLDGVISWSVRPGIELFGRLENILDADYEMVYGYGRPGFSLQTGIRLAR